MILLSATYRVGGAANPQAAAVDPDNRLLARSDGNGSTSSRCAMRSWRRPARSMPRSAAQRSTCSPVRLRHGGPLYGFIDRQNLPGLFRTFDFASPDSSSPQRYQTTVPQQALFMLNGPFVHLQARAMLARAELAALHRASAKVRGLYRVVYARDPDVDEVRLGVQFVAETAKTPLAGPPVALTPWERYAQVLMMANEFAFVD